MDVECTMCSSYKCEDLPVICSRKSNSKSEGDLLVRSCTTKQTDQDCVNCTQKRGKCVSCTSSTNDIEGDKVINSTPSTTRMEGECVICSCNTIEKCEECEVSCCKKELSTHRFGNFCQPWEIREMEGVGRIMIASRDITAWERVLYDEALVMAPADHPVCVGCLSKVDGKLACSKCGWAVCKDVCSESIYHRDECIVLQAKKIMPTVRNWTEHHWTYSSLAVLRMLMTRDKSPENKAVISQLMDHWDTRSKDPQVCEGLKKMTDFFQQGLGMSHIQQENVQNAFGTLKTNAVEYAEGRALYPLVSVLSHSCSANLEPIEEPRKTAMFRAKRPIKAGEELSMRYTSNLVSKYIIQGELLREWLFQCTCTRCADPTEAGSYFSELKCACGNFYQPGQDDMSVCSKCSNKMNHTSQINKERILLQEISNMTNENSLLNLKERLLKHGYHSQHHVIFNINMRYLEIVDICSEETLSKVSRSASNVLETLALIDPGQTKINGKYLKLMLECELRLLQARQRREEVDEHQYRVCLKDIIQGRLRATKLQSKFYK